MKKYFQLLLLATGSLVLITSCKKSEKDEAKRLPVTNNAYLRIVHVAPNFATALGVADNFHLYINDTRINATALVYATTTANLVDAAPPNATLATYPTTVTAYPAQTLNTDTYAAVAAGTETIRLSLVGKNLVDSLTFVKLPVSLGAGQYYTLFITDNIRDGQTAPQILSQDLFSKPDTGKYSIRFAHMVLNDTAGKTVDVYSTKQAATIYSAVAPGTVTAFSTFLINPTIPSIPDTIIVRRAGTLNELTRYPPNKVGVKPITSTIGAVSYPNSQRVYTIIYKGNASVTTGAKARSLVWINNR
jgi:hypothetical protein